MAGHSHSANIKYRKDRQDSARSQLFLKLRKKIKNIIREEREVNEKSLSVARENKFPKEKVYQIWEKIKSSGGENYSTRAFYQAPFGILVYLEDSKNVNADSVSKLRLKSLPLSLLTNYFQVLYGLKINSKGENDNLEEYLLTHLPSEIWEKLTYDEKKRELISSDKEEIVKIKKIIEENKLALVIEQEKSFWKALIPCQLIEKEEIDYYQELERQLENALFYTNIEN